MRWSPRRPRPTIRHLMLAIGVLALMLFVARDAIRGWLWPPTFPFASVKAATERAGRVALGR
jgi:hypothetical protein